MKIVDWVPTLEKAAANRAKEAHLIAGSYTLSLMGTVLNKSQVARSEHLHAKAKHAVARHDLWLQRRLAHCN